MAERTEITALHEDNVQALLARLGIAQAYASGELACAVCGERVRERGLGALRMEEGRPVASCGKLQCLEDFHE